MKRLIATLKTTVFEEFDEEDMEEYISEEKYVEHLKEKLTDRIFEASISEEDIKFKVVDD